MGILSWLRRLRLDDEDFKEEIRAHLAIAADERMADGADRKSAQLASLNDFGNVTLTTEAARRVWTPRWLEAVQDHVRDVRHAVRSLAKNPAFSHPDYQYLRDHDRAFSGLMGSVAINAGLGRGRKSRSILGELVTGNYFDVQDRRDYLPFLQAYRPAMLLHTRGAAPVDRLVDQARARIAALDADLPILYARPLADRTGAALLFFKLTSAMLFVFGLAGMALAALGTYGLVSYTVTQSTHEIGIRMALGARGASVVRAFVGRGLRLGAIGAAAGIVAALGMSRLLRSALFGVSATDAASFAQALIVVLGGVVAATIVPAWRASRTDPLRALRHQ